MSDRNTIPVDKYEVLKRLHNCNWQQLAKRLGVTVQTLKRWRNGEDGKNAAEKCQLLMEATLRAADAEFLLLQTNWANVHTVGGRR